MIEHEDPTYSHAVNAVAFHPGNVRDSEAVYHYTAMAEVEGLAVPLGVDIDTEGHIMMIEVFQASQVFPKSVLDTFEQIDVDEES